MSDKAFKTVFITKYALSEGIIETRAEIVNGKYASGYGWHGPGDWHETKEAALKKVGEMVAVRRKSMAKAEAKLLMLEKAIAAGDLNVKTR